MKRRILFCLLLGSISTLGVAQRLISGEDVNYRPIPEILQDRSINIGDSIFIFFGNCKNNTVAFYKNATSFLLPIQSVVNSSLPPKKKKLFLQIHGNVLYNSSYRSYIDTPFTQNDIVQHSVQTVLNFTIKDKYPIKATIRNRSSNSAYFENVTDVNLEFSRKQLLDNIKLDLKKKAEGYVNKEQLFVAENKLKLQHDQINVLKRWMSSPERMQELIEEKEREFLKENHVYDIPKRLSKVDTLDPLIDEQNLSIKNKPFLSDKAVSRITELRELNDRTNGKKEFQSLLVDTISTTVNRVLGIKDSSYLEKFNAKKLQIEKLEDSLRNKQSELTRIKKNISDSIAGLNKEINSIVTPGALRGFMNKYNIPNDDLTKAHKILLSINKIGLGRNWIDYSELTVKNISLSGIALEMNPKPYYFAFAAGRVNYRFRDFVLRDRRELPVQSLYIIRAGLGDKDKNNIILSFYNGTKPELTNSSNIQERVLGVSAEAKYYISSNTSIVGEVAKSSYNTDGVNQSAASLMGKAFNLNVNSNVAYSVKLLSEYPATKTKIWGTYKSVGERFQSFNLYPTNSKQNSWMLRVNQHFWKNRISVDASVRKNDFETPLSISEYEAKTIFKSIQLSVKIPKYPFLTIGYFPLTQITVAPNNLLLENHYQTLNAIAGYSYTVGKVPMNSNFSMNKFYNNTRDTGFIYYNSSSWLLTHSAFFNRFHLQSSAGETKQDNLHLLILEQSLSVELRKYISLTGSFKLNRLNRKESLIGGLAGLNILLKKIGTIQLNYEKTYMPGYSRNLIPVDIGRATFYKEF